MVGLTCVFAFLILLALHGKPYYIGPLYPTLFGVGAFVVERFAYARGTSGTILRWSAVAVIVGYGGIFLLPFGIPILPPARMSSYAHAIGASEALRTNRGEMGLLPQDYADMLGWPEQVAAVARVYQTLPPADRAQAVIIAANYGEAGPVDFFGPRYGLPPAVSTAGTYWFFGPGEKPGTVAVTIGIDSSELAPFYGEVTTAARADYPWTVSEERNVPINIARRPKRTLQQVWPEMAGRN